MDSESLNLRRPRVRTSGSRTVKTPTSEGSAGNRTVLFKININKSTLQVSVGTVGQGNFVWEID